MSLFKKRVDRFCDQFNLPLSTRVSLYGHYPLFKAVWLNQHGRGFLASASRPIVTFAKHYEISVPLRAKNQKAFKVPISFQPPNLNSFQEIFFGDEYESPWDLSDCRSMIDLGANIGLATQYFLTQAPLEKVVMVEANPILAKNLRSQFANYDLSCEFVIKEACVSGVSGEKVEFTISDNNRDSGIGVQVRDQKTLSFETLSLQELLQENKFDKVDILKMDIEGAEYSIIEKDPTSLQKFRFLFCEVHGDSAQRQRFAESLENLNFEVHTLSSNDAYACAILAAKNRIKRTP